ncbi:MAG: Hpt domain-containing protein [Bacteroidales bacterium]|jgi:HPt (histidine-containing phosphotransfer) domain-containing protein|nr:Hpt domain-containing protein [Bacteroidales bacterium]
MITDIICLQQVTGESSEVMREMIDLFLGQIEETAKELEILWKDGNWTEISRLAHKMKSSSLVMGVEPMAAGMAELEMLAKENHAEKCRELINMFHSLAGRVKTEFNSHLASL